jgi:outer membrane protein, heavy metal efflux system
MPVCSGVDRHCLRASFLVPALAAFLLVTAPNAFGQVTHAPVTRRPLGRDLPVYEPASGASERRDVPLQNPTGPVSLRDAVSLALMQNPSLAGFAWETRALEARILQAGRPPNPTASFLLEDVGASKSGSSLEQFVQPQATIQLSQLIELGGKRAARGQVATANRDLAAWDYEAARMDVLTQVSRAFTDVLAAQETVALTNDTTRLVEEVRRSVGARVEAGVVSPIEETRATVALANVRVESLRAHRALESSRTRLALLWGSPAPAFTVVAGALKAAPPPLPSLAELATRIDQSPELARWAMEMSQREAAIAVERSKAVPDVSVIAGYRRFTDVDSNAFVVGGSIALPFFDRNKGGIAEAISRLAKAHEEERAAHGRVSALLADAYASLAAAHDEVTALRADVLPGARQTFEAVTEGYRLGKFGYIEVLDAQRTMINGGGQYLRALSDYYKAAATIERLTGAPLFPGTSLLSLASKE